MTKAKEAFKDYVAKMHLRYINQTKDEMLREVEEDRELNKLHDVKVVIATCITNSLCLPDPNMEEDIKYMEKLGFILHEDENGKYHVDVDKAEKDSEAEMYIDRVRGLRKGAAKVVIEKIKEAMVNDENKVTITLHMISKEYNTRLKYFDEWLSPELKKAGFNPVLIDDEHYDISW